MTCPPAEPAWPVPPKLQLTAAPGELLPEALGKLDPQLIENVCNDVMDSGGQLGELFCRAFVGGGRVGCAGYMCLCPVCMACEPGSAAPV